MSWADLTWNAMKSEVNVSQGNSIHELLNGRLGPSDGQSVELAAEEVASGVIGALFEIQGRELRALFEESAPFSSYDSPSPDAVEGWYGSLHSQITGHCGALRVSGRGGGICAEGDMIFPSSADANGEPVAEIPMKLSVRGDLRETKDYFVKLIDLSPGWKIEVEQDSSVWQQFITWALYDDRAQFEAKPGTSHQVAFRVGNRYGAPNPGVATFELVHVIGGDDDVVLDRYRVEMWNDREVSDLSVDAFGNIYNGLAGENLRYEVSVTNLGPDRADGVTLHVEGPEQQGAVFAQASTLLRSQICEQSTYFESLTCDLGTLEAYQSVTVTLEYESVLSLQAGDKIEAQFHVTSRVYDPSRSGVGRYNNETTATIVANPQTPPPTVEPPPVVVPPVPDVSDRDALIALYNATDGPNWENTDDLPWLTEDPNSAVGGWHGVTVHPDDANRVWFLQLRWNCLRGELPSSIGNLTFLNTLFLTQNKAPDVDNPSACGNLEGPIPANLGNLTNLQMLYLSDNNLSGAIPSGLGNPQSNLEELYLANNRLSGEIPASLGDLRNLYVLDLSGNRLGGQIPATLAELPNLEELYLSGGGNDFTGCIPAALFDIDDHDLDKLKLDPCGDGDGSATETPPAETATLPLFGDRVFLNGGHT